MSRQGSVFALLTFLVFPIALALHATAAPPGYFATAKPLNDSLAESFKTDVPVSGNVIAGVMFADGVAALSKDNLVANVLASDVEQRLCVRVISRDGLYSAVNTFVVAPTKGALRALFQYPTKHDLSQFPNNHLAVAISGSACEGVPKSTTYFAARTVGKPVSGMPARLTIDVNSFGATDVQLRIEPSSTNPAGVATNVQCTYLSEGRRTTFDYVCAFDPKTLGGTNPVRLSIIRERYGRDLAPIKFTVQY